MHIYIYIYICVIDQSPCFSSQVIYACNVLDSDLESGNAMVDLVAGVAAKEGAEYVVVSAQVFLEL